MELGSGAITNVRAMYQLFLFLTLPYFLPLIQLLRLHREERLEMGNDIKKRGDVPTRSGSQLFHNAQDRITSKNPAASTKASRMTAEGWVRGSNRGMMLVYRSSSWWTGIDINPRIQLIDRGRSCRGYEVSLEWVGLTLQSECHDGWYRCIAYKWV